MLRRDDIKTLAHRTATQVRKRRGNLLSEREQLKQYEERAAKGLDGFRDIADSRGIDALASYLGAMKKLKQKAGK